jgi:hypothetical protein
VNKAVETVGKHQSCLAKHQPTEEVNMWNKKLLLSTIVATAIVVLAPSVGAVVEVFINVPPPPLRYESPPQARKGYVWAGGHWNWVNNRHVWTRGHWERERTGQFYHPNRWVEREGRWTNERGRWDRQRPRNDLDRDGIPNAVDRDRDGDGVPNRVDRHPDSPRRK